MIRRFLNHVASLPLWLISGMAAAETVFVPCDFTIPKPPSPVVHVAPVIHHHVERRHAHRHLVGKRGRLGLQVRLARGMCPVWAEDLGGPAGFEPFGGWLAEETAATDYGDDDAAGDAAFGFAGGGSSLEDSGWPVGPSLALETPTWTPMAPCPLQRAPAVPEAPTWALLALGFAGLAMVRFKRRSIVK